MTLRLALVHDWLNQRGGAEDVLEALVRLFPDAPVYTSMYAPDRMPASYRNWNIRTLWIDRLPGIHSHHQPYLPVYPAAWGQLNLSEYDVVLSNKSGFCHGFQFGSQTKHVCYCLAPTRYVWRPDDYLAREGVGRAARLALKPLIAGLRRWDFAAAQRVTRFIAISTEIQTRIAESYQRPSDIIYPPVSTDRFQPLPDHGDYFLVVSRLIPYKRIDLAVEACTALGLSLKVGGTGRDIDRLRGLAGPTVEFLGFVPDDALPALMAGCRAFLFPGLEDFGIAPVQAQACGRPVIAFNAGGARDTVLHNTTGLLFDEQSVESLSAALTAFDERKFDADVIRAHALQFDERHFARAIRQVVERAAEATP